LAETLGGSPPRSGRPQTSANSEFLELILQDELLVRSERLIQAPRDRRGLPRAEAARRLRLVVQSVDPEETTLRPGYLPFHSETRDVLFLGPPGVGKSFLVQAIGYQAIKQGFVVLYRSIFDVVRDFLHDDALETSDKMLARYLKPDLLIVDDMGMKQLPKRSGEVLFEIIMRRYETRST